MRRFIAVSIVAVSAAIDNGAHAAVRLSGPLVADGNVAFFQIAPDGSHVVYQADQKVDGVNELFSVSLDERSIVNLSGTVWDKGVRSDAGEFQISSDSGRVVFRAHTTPDGNTISLLSAPLDGSSPPSDLDGTFQAPFGNFSLDGDFKITPDGKRVVFLSDPDYTLFSRNIDGSGPRVNLDTPELWVTWNQITPDSRRLVGRDWRNHGFYAQSIDGSSGPMRLDPVTGNVRNIFPVTSDGKRVVFTVLEGPEPKYPNPSTQQDVHYSTLLDGTGTPIKLNDTLLQNGKNPQPSPPDYQLSADDGYLVFRFNEGSDTRTELFARPVDGSGPARLLSDPDSVGSVYYHGFDVSPTNEYVFFYGEQPAGVSALFANSLPGGTRPWQISQPITEGYLAGAKFTPDGERVVYHNVVNQLVTTPRGSGSQATVLTAQITPIDGSRAPIELISDPAGPAVITDSRISPDGSFVVFSVDTDGFYFVPNDYDFAETHVLYAVPTTGGVPRQVTQRLGDERIIASFEIAPDSRSIIYLANQEDASVFELFSVPVAGLGLLGDYNGDGMVDAADYVAWAENDGSQEGFHTWRANYGRVAQAIAFSNDFSSVPEPATWVLVASAVASMLNRRRRFE